MAGGNKTKDKFIVSFNSDTSDSEDDDVTTVPVKVTAPSTSALKDKTGPAKDPAPVMNGHVEPQQQNGDVSTSLNITSTTALGDNRSPEQKKYQSNSPSSSSILQKTDRDNFGLADSLGSKSSKQDSAGERHGVRNIGARSADKFSDLESTSRPSSAYSSRENKTSEQLNHDLDSAYTRAKERNRLLSSRKPDQELLIDLSDTNDNFVSTKPSNKMETPKRRERSFSADLEDISGFYDSKATKTAPMVNGLQTLDFEGLNVKQTTDSDENFGFDADLLIYASSGTSANSRSNIGADPKYDSNSFDNIRSDRKYESGNKRPQALDDDFMEQKPFRRQSSRTDDKESLLSPKDKYIEDKFSAICNKYGSKRDRPSTANKKPENDIEGEMYGMVRVKTSGKDNIPTKPSEEEEDLGFSEEKTPRPKLTFDDIIKWDKGSTSDLIQRILADARKDTETTTSTRREPKKTIEDEYLSGQDSYKTKIKPYEDELGGDHKYDYRVAQPSLLERRLASLTGNSKQDDDIEPYSYTKPSRQDPYSYNKQLHQDSYSYTKPSQKEDDHFYKRKTRGSSASRDLDDSDALSLTDSSGVGRYIPWKERQKARYHDDEDDLPYGASATNYQSNLLRPPVRYDESESDDESHRSSRGRDPVLPDEWFTPQRSEDTAVVVKERTSEVRNMVDNQNEVLGRLHKASKEFDELDAEIRALKQQCIENQVARQMVIDDILSDAARSSTYDDEPAPNPRRYTRGSYASRDSYTPSYSSPYTSSYRKSRASSTSRFDSDLDSDRLGGYALGSVARSKWGEPGGSRAFRSASVSRFDNFEEEEKSYDKYGLYNPKRSVRAGSCLDDFETKSNHNFHPDDESECTSVKSYPSDKGMDDGREDESGYRSRYGSSKYGSSLAVPSTTRAYSVSRESRSPSRRSFASSDYSSPSLSYERPRTRGMSLPPPEKPFQSRFLSKVREKKASGVDISSKNRDKPFKSRFLTRSFDSDYYSGSSSRGSLASTPDKSYSSTRSYRSRDNSGTEESTKATEAAN